MLNGSRVQMLAWKGTKTGEDHHDNGVLKKRKLLKMRGMPLGAIQMERRQPRDKKYTNALCAYFPK